MRRDVLKTVCACAVLTILTAVIAFGANTKGMVYQGRLTDTNGRSLTNVTSIRFVIYDALDGGIELWGETHTDIVLDDQGVFTVELGKDTILAASIFSSGDVYLQLIVDDVVMDKRQLFGAAPFAYTMGSHGAVADQVLKWSGTSWVPGDDEIGDVDSDWKVEGSNMIAIPIGNIGIGTGSPTFKLDVQGTVRASNFSGSGSGLSGIGSGSLVDEPGIAYEFNETFVTLTGTALAYDSIVIEAPGPGYVVVLARAMVQISHVFGTEDLLRMSVGSVAGAIDYGLTAFWRTNRNSPTNLGADEVSILWCMKVEAVAAGSHKYYLNADVWSGNGDIARMHMTAMFFPTAYGDVVVQKAAWAGGSEPNFVSGIESDGTSNSRLAPIQSNLPAETDIVGSGADQSTRRELEQRVARLESLLQELIREAKK